MATARPVVAIRPLRPVVAAADTADLLVADLLPVVAVDTVDAGYRETVIIVQGSSARMASSCKDTPVDTAIVGIVDAVTLK